MAPCSGTKRKPKSQAVDSIRRAVCRNSTVSLSMAELAMMVSTTEPSMSNAVCGGAGSMASPVICCRAVE